MKGKLTVLLLALCLVTLLTACGPWNAVTVRGSGNVVTQEEDITGFDRVDASHAFKVEINEGDTFSVVIRIDDNLVRYLDVVKRGSTLRISLEPGRLYNIRRATMEAEVTMPDLTGVELSGASQGEINGFRSSKRLAVDLSGASALRGDIDAGDARFDLSGASQVELSGSADDVTIEASGASIVRLADFSVADADVDASGASRVTVNVDGTLDVEASGASHVTYLGDATLGRVDTSGASSVRRD